LRRKQGTIHANAVKKIKELNLLAAAQHLAAQPPAATANEDDQEINEGDDGIDDEWCSTACKTVTIKHFEEGVYPWEPASHSMFMFRVTNNFYNNYKYPYFGNRNFQTEIQAG
jgi:hypothetical protein